MNLSVYKYVVFFLGIYVGYAQDMYVETSLSSASFKEFNNDQGANTLDNNYSKPVELGIGLGLIFNITNNQRLKWDFGVNYTNYKINTSIANSSTPTPVQYNLNYVTFKTGPYFSVVNHSRIKLQLHAHNSLDFLIFGSNEYRDVYVDLARTESFSRLVSNYHYGATFEIVLSDSNSLYISYDSKNSITDTIEADQSYQLNAMSILMGIRFKLFSKPDNNNTNK